MCSFSVQNHKWHPFTETIHYNPRRLRYTLMSFYGFILWNHRQNSKHRGAASTVRKKFSSAQRTETRFKNLFSRVKKVACVCRVAPWESSQQRQQCRPARTADEEANEKKKEIDIISKMIYFHMQIAFIPGESSLLWIHQKQGISRVNSNCRIFQIAELQCQIHPRSN